LRALPPRLRELRATAVPYAVSISEALRSTAVSVDAFEGSHEPA
jgi:hypothetical protein